MIHWEFMYGNMVHDEGYVVSFVCQSCVYSYLNGNNVLCDLDFIPYSFFVRQPKARGSDEGIEGSPRLWLWCVASYKSSL